MGGGPRLSAAACSVASETTIYLGTPSMSRTLLPAMASPSGSFDSRELDLIGKASGIADL
jgi:hypothetical protein